MINTNVSLPVSHELTPEHAAVDGSVAGLVALLALVLEGKFHELNAGLFHQLEHCQLICGAEHDLEVVPEIRR